MNLASTYSTISHVHHDRNNYKEGLSYCEKSLDIFKRCLRHNHPNLAVAHTNMANNLGELKRFDEAILHANEAIKISRLNLPSDHKDIKERERILHALQTTQQYYQHLTINNSR
jgi:tetratricopeptide (TPR) repeat protein